MTTTKTKKAVATARKATAKVPTPAKAIGDAAVGLEHDIAAALRQELKHLRRTVGTIQKDVRTALDRVEKALQDVADAKPSANGRTVKKAPAKKAAPKPAAKKAAPRGRTK